MVQTQDELAGTAALSPLMLSDIPPVQQACGNQDCQWQVYHPVSELMPHRSGVMFDQGDEWSASERTMNLFLGKREAHIQGQRAIESAVSRQQVQRDLNERRSFGPLI
jgi:hypothetical protein